MNKIGCERCYKDAYCCVFGEYMCLKCAMEAMLNSAVKEGILELYACPVCGDDLYLKMRGEKELLTEDDAFDYLTDDLAYGGYYPVNEEVE